MQVIISNTTEVGIQLVNDDIHAFPPVSFPGKLLAFLHERYRAFDGSGDSGMVIVPTELVSDNGKKLQAIVLELAELNGLEKKFIEWLKQHNPFCSSLVDRIVPGKPDVATLATMEEMLGYNDQLLTMSEAYRLWAIEGDEKVKNILSFAQADNGVIIAPDITLYKELKLRLLNGTHTLSCGLAFLAGFNTVKEAMDDVAMASYISSLMLNELASSIPYEIDSEVARNFGSNVLDRFRNPQIKHQWINITVQYSSKMKMRNVPILLKHYETQNSCPELFALGFAAYLFFTKPVRLAGGTYYGEFNGLEYPIQDDMAESFMKRWNSLAHSELVKEVLSDTALWEHNLFLLPGFYDSVLEKLEDIMHSGARAAIEAFNTKAPLLST
jgi:tagaturonate reductase